MNLLAKGFVLGLAVGGVGPIDILCIRRTLQFGRLSGLFTGLGATVADTIYGVISAFSLTMIIDSLIQGTFWLRLVGGVFLIYLGVRTFFDHQTEKVGKVGHKTLMSDFFSTFFLTLTNPLTIITYITIFGALGLGDEATLKKTWVDSAAIVSGVFIGSALWWIGLSEGVTLFREKVNGRLMRIVNRCGGIAILGFGLYALVGLLQD